MMKEGMEDDNKLTYTF